MARQQKEIVTLKHTLNAREDDAKPDIMEQGFQTSSILLNDLLQERDQTTNLSQK